MAKEKKDYAVGFKKPPKETQFKPGQSGNPKGRPKGTKNLATDLEEELAETIRITEGGETRVITKQRAMVKTLCAKALKGDSRSGKVLFDLALGLQSRDADNTLDEDLSTEDAAILDAYVMKNRALDDPTVEPLHEDLNKEQHDE